ncbi:MAG: hypothetical protein HDS39_00535 [Bacteroides sp.]|nr:hypothetical protein [Bacteroides sp.]
MKLRHFFPCLLLAGMAVTMVSCSEEATLPQGQGRNVTMTVNISRVGDNTRAVLTEKDGDLNCTWEENDLILVADGNGNKLGVLSIKNGVGESTATFSGDINTDAEGETDIKFLYLGPKTKTELEELPDPVVIDYSAQDGTLGWLSANDFFYGGRKVEIVNSYVNVDGVSLSRQISFGKFDLQLPEGVTYGGEAITVSGSGIYTQASVSHTGNCTFSNTEGEDAKITVTPAADSNGTFYLAVLPNAGEEIAPTFSVTIDGTEYSCTLGARTWQASEFVRVANADGSFSGVGLNMEASTGSPVEPEDEDDLVGPAFKVKDSDGNEVWVRFTRANLHYNVKEDSWYLPEKQTDFVNKSGRYVVSGEGSEDREIIDMFRWGATGIDDEVYKPRPADFWKASKSENSGTKVSALLPSEDSDLNTRLYDKTIYPDLSFNGTPFDWGVAYSNTGKYYTLTESELRSIITNNCVVLGKVDGTAGAILTDSKNFDALKIKTNKPSLTKLSLSVSQQGSNVTWDMVSLTYDQLTELNAVFFPAVGYNDPSKALDYNTLGWYWTSTLRTSPNATAWNFNGASVTRSFNLEGKYKGFAMSVRLVKQVKEPANP